MDETIDSNWTNWLRDVVTLEVLIWSINTEVGVNEMSGLKFFSGSSIVNFDWSDCDDILVTAALNWLVATDVDLDIKSFDFYDRIWQVHINPSKFPVVRDESEELVAVFNTIDDWVTVR